MCKLSVSLREGTTNVHGRAERTGIVRDMLNDRITVQGYQLYLRNLYEIYSSLEHCRRCADLLPKLGQFIRPEFCRAHSIGSDLSFLYQGDWQTEIPVLESAVAYRDRIHQLARQARVAELVAHAYVRYLGDLSGGQLLATQLARRPGLTDKQLSFYKFERIPDLQAAKRRFRQTLDDFGKVTADSSLVVAEARRAFQFNIGLSIAAKKYVESVVQRTAGAE